MVKMGTFRGIPVYVLQYSHEYQAIDSNEEKMYVCEGKLFYHGKVVGMVEGNQLTAFYEERFNEARRKDWTADAAQKMAKVTETAETRPQEEEKPELSDAERAAANNIVDEFLASWRDNIDSEIAKLSLRMREVEEETRAANKV